MRNNESQNLFWGENVARSIIEKYPNEKLYTTAAGISPSGKVHFGNFRDIITAFVVGDALLRVGKKARVIFSWDEFDRFRKVPAGVPASFEEHFGKPLVKVPDPKGCHESYARHYEEELEEATGALGINIEYLYQGKKYSSGDYDKHIITALQKRNSIAEILYSFMSEKGIQKKKIVKEEYIKNFYPIRVYSRFSGKDNTEILGYDEDKTITYKCHDTGREDSFDLTKQHIVKLSWKTDWAMRWMYENVTFEPGGPDHAAPGSSFRVSSVITEKIFNFHAPEFIEYKFVGLQGQGSKMSGSKGNVITPLELLEIYQPSLLKWMYLRKNPSQSFSVALNTEIYRQYDEFDRTVLASNHKKLSDVEDRQLTVSFDGTNNKKYKRPMPMRQAVALGQIVQWDTDKVKEILLVLDLMYDIESIETRLSYARTWLLKYNPDEMISLLSKPNDAYWNEMSDVNKEHVNKLRETLERGILDIKKLEKVVYAIPKDESLSEKENVSLQRVFFKDVYHLLIGEDTGPRLSTFLWAIDRAKVLQLLKL